MRPHPNETSKEIKKNRGRKRKKARILKKKPATRKTQNDKVSER
jgi:hypothetical protein